LLLIRNLLRLLFNFKDQNIDRPALVHSNFILKPKHQQKCPDTPQSQSPSKYQQDTVNVYQTINNEVPVPKPDSNQLTAASKSRRRGLEEIFPSINLNKDSQIKIKDPNWCPASDLYESDPEEDASVITTSFDVDCEAVKFSKFSNFFEEQVNGRRSRSNSGSFESGSYGSRPGQGASFVQVSKQRFGQLNILY